MIYLLETVQPGPSSDCEVRKRPLLTLMPLFVRSYGMGISYLMTILKIDLQCWPHLVHLLRISFDLFARYSSLQHFSLALENIQLITSWTREHPVCFLIFFVIAFMSFKFSLRSSYSCISLSYSWFDHCFPMSCWIGGLILSFTRDGAAIKITLRRW